MQGRARRAVNDAVGKFHDRVGFALRFLRVQGRSSYAVISGATGQILESIKRVGAPKVILNLSTLMLDFDVGANLKCDAGANFGPKWSHPPGLQLYSLPSRLTMDGAIGDDDAAACQERYCPEPALYWHLAAANRPLAMDRALTFLTIS